MRVCDYHKQDNKSVLDLPTPLELFKEEHTAEEYDEKFLSVLIIYGSMPYSTEYSHKTLIGL